MLGIISSLSIGAQKQLLGTLLAPHTQKKNKQKKILADVRNG